MFRKRALSHYTSRPFLNADISHSSSANDAETDPVHMAQLLLVFLPLITILASTKYSNAITNPCAVYIRSQCAAALRLGEIGP